MNSQLLREPAVIGTAAALVLLAAGTGAYFSRRKRPTPEEIERARRDFLFLNGRIIDGTVLDIDERFSSGPGKSVECVVFYKYEIAGVSYESSQDVSQLDAQMAEATSKPGFPASVRYDPHNPMNSIVLAETWNGLRHSSTAVARMAGPRAQRELPAQPA